MAEPKVQTLGDLPTRSLESMRDNLISRIGLEQTRIELARVEIGKMERALDSVADVLRARRYFKAKAPAAPATRGKAKGRKG